MIDQKLNERLREIVEHPFMSEAFILKTISQIKALVIESLGEEIVEETKDDMRYGVKEGYNYHIAEMKRRWR